MAHALVSHIAETANVRAIFIKGPYSERLGVRRSRESADVDVIVLPETITLFTRELRAKGWDLRPSDPDEVAFPKHSVTLFHPNWPNDIDLHFRYPGLDADVYKVFDAMWSASDQTTMAGRAIRVPKMPLAVCITALHALRTPWTKRSKDELEFLHSMDLSSHRAEILELARAMGAIPALAPFLRRHFGESVVGSIPLPSDEWRRRILSRSPGAARILAILAVPLKERPLLLWRSLMPHRDGILARNSKADLSWGARFEMQKDRWKFLIKGGPTLIQDVVSYLSGRGPLPPRQ